MTPVTTDESTHVMAARNSGDCPVSEAPNSFSAAARVATPSLVKRK